MKQYIEIRGDLNVTKFTVLQDTVKQMNDDENMYTFKLNVNLVRDGETKLDKNITCVLYIQDRVTNVIMDEAQIDSVNKELESIDRTEIEKLNHFVHNIRKVDVMPTNESN